MTCLNTLDALESARAKQLRRIQTQNALPNARPDPRISHYGLLIVISRGGGFQRSTYLLLIVYLLGLLISDLRENVNK